MDTWRAAHSHSHPQPAQIQLKKNALTLAPVVVLDAVPASPGQSSANRGILSPRSEAGSSSSSSAQTPSSAIAGSSTEQSFPKVPSLKGPCQTRYEASHHYTTYSSATSPEPPVQLRVSIAIDPDQYYTKLVKGKVHVVLVLTALVQLPDRREIWVEQSRSELLSLEKGRTEGHFVKTFQLQIREDFLVIGFTLLAVPPPSASSKLIATFPTLDGLLPWAETSVAIEHFALPSIDLNSDRSRGGYTHVQASSFSTPLMDISLFPDMGLRKSKHTVATLNVTVEEVLPSIPFQKEISEKHRFGPSFSQTYHGHTLRGTNVYGREHLYESSLAFAVPLKLLQLLAQDERRVLEELEKEPGVSLSDMIQAVPLDHQPNPITRGASFMETLRRGAMRQSPAAKERALNSTRTRQIGLSEEDSQLQKLLRQQISAHRNIEVYYQNMILRLEQKLKENMEIGQGSFRRSPEKKEESLQWVPINCCIQDFLVHDDGNQINYQTTTVGAAAAHSTGFARWSNPQMLGKAPPLGAYWSKQERGSDLMRDFKALLDVLVTCSTDFSSIIASSEGAGRGRVPELVKEIQFLNNEIVSFGELLLSDYLSPLSIEGSASFVCGEIASVVERLKQADFASYEPRKQDQTQELTAQWLGHCKRTIREVVICTQDLGNYIAIAIQHECLMADATLVATPEWIVSKKSRECCLSQIITTLATSFRALLEDWWTNMAIAIQAQQALEQENLDQHLTECQHYLSRDINFINEETSDAVQEDYFGNMESYVQEESPAAGTSRRHRSPAKRNGKGMKSRRPSTTSNNSSAGSLTGGPGGRGLNSRSRSYSKHPLESVPQVRDQNDLFWDQLINLGWLAQIGSLLSTQGNELGMLLDYAQAAVDARESVTIGFHALPQSSTGLPASWPQTGQIDLDEIGDSSIQISGRRGKMTLSFGLDPLQFSLLPDQLKAGTSKIQIWPVLFSQGINEMQTISNLTGKSPVQQAINEEGLRHIQNYVSRYNVWRAQSKLTQGINQARPRKVRGRSNGPYSTWGGNANISTASLMSNISSDWDMVPPFKAELWDGESLVTELLNHLETAVLGHSDKSRSQLDSFAGSLPSSSSQNIQATPNNTDISNSTVRNNSVSSSASGILESMMEFGTSRFFSFKGSKDTSVLECAEALTRALGQIKAVVGGQAIESTSQIPGKQKSPGDDIHLSVNSAVCECFPQPSHPVVTLPFSSLWVSSHIVSCKSAKDRSSMSVTLSQVNLLRACHGLQTSPEQNGGDDWQAILDAMRSEIGVRIKNVERNLKLGDFAKDLLWMSAFGSSEQPQSPPLVFNSASAVFQESSYTPDALTFVRSLLPENAHSSKRSLGVAESARTIAASVVEAASTNFVGDNAELVESRSPVEEMENDTVSSPQQLISPIPLESPPLPPLKLIRSPTGPALDPVVTLDTNVKDGDSILPSHRLSESQNVLSETLSLPSSYLDGQQPTEEGHYTSFPGSFDEPLLAARLARSLGLNSPGKSSRPDLQTSELSHQQTRPQDRQAQHSPRTAGMHCSTPSWSSQQSIFYQQQLDQSNSQISPYLTKRPSSFGQGLGLILKTKDVTQDALSDTPILQFYPHARHQSQGSVDFGASSVPSSQLNGSTNTPLRSPSGQTGSPLYGGDAVALMGKKGKFAFNKVQLKFLPVAYRPPRRMTTGLFES
ncbi:Phosphatidylinositol 3,4,5-trisphosphate-dependent Rac exchanger 2 protein [Mortierella sp. AM989]|nr:Phosphatidylinositol 3,4,5-trisphosphate-dependent Rac exchanger 2 protein [Mortierella sp. AM989]